MVAVVVKVVSAALSVGMFVGLARVMSPHEYGRFAFAFSLATFLGIVCECGQTTVALRFVPIHVHDRERGRLRGLVLAGYALVTSFAVLTGLVVLLVMLVLGHVDGLVLLACLLVLPLALSEYQGGVYRGLGMLGMSLVPKEIVWRLSVVAVCGLTAYAEGHGTKLSSDFAIVVCAITLGVVVLAQFAVVPRVWRMVVFGASPSLDRRAWIHTTLGLWVNTILQKGAQNAAVALAGLALAASQTGGLFAALKLALLLNFFLTAGNLVSAPIIARMWHTRNLDDLQHMCAKVTLGSAVPAFVLFVLYVVAGRWLLDLFGPGYSDYYSCLLILAGSQVVNSMCGQTSAVMNMTGNERRMMGYVLFSNVIPLGSIPFVAPHLGPVYAAVAIGTGLVLWNVLAALWTPRHLGIDTSIVGAIRHIRAPRPSGGVSVG